MKNWIIALLLVLCLVPGAFAQEVIPKDVVTGDTRIAILSDSLPPFADSIRAGNLTAPGAIGALGDVTHVQTLSEALLLLNAGRVDAMIGLYQTARYVAARNPDLVAVPARYDTSMCMLAAADRQDLIALLNEGIQGMLDDGTVQALWQTHVEDVIESGEPVKAAAPENEGGQKLRVGVSGDIPPMDYVDAAGDPAGFNTAMLSELAKREHLTLEIIQVDSGARFAALASGRIDVFFWQTRLDDLSAENYAGSIEEYKISENEAISCLTTVPYVKARAGWLFGKAYVEEALAK